MALTSEQRNGIRYWLENIHEDELDCDQFSAFLAEYVDDALEDASFRALMDLHRRLCHECREEYQTLLKALGRES